MKPRAAVITNRIGLSLSILALGFFVFIDNTYLGPVHWKPALMMAVAPWMIARLIIWTASKPAPSEPAKTWPPKE